MAKYIKSHSNYVLKTKHQETSKGTIYERDITTIGGRNQFAKGQVPIYQSGNFVITVNSDNSSYKKVNEGQWYKNEYGEIWTDEIVNTYELNANDFNDKTIEVKNDYHDLRDFVYYGSCSELVRASIDNILRNYPGELFIPDEEIYVMCDGSLQYSESAATVASIAMGDCDYSVFRGLDGYYYDLNDKKERKPFELPGEPNKRLILIDNPFGIDIHHRKIPNGVEDVWKYFADGGIENFEGFLREDCTEKAGNKLSIKNNENPWDKEWDLNKSYEIEWEVIYDGLGETRTERYITEILITGEIKCEVDTELSIDITAETEIEYNGTNTTGETGVGTICPGQYIGHVEIKFKDVENGIFVTPEKVFQGAGGIDYIDVNENSDEVISDAFIIYLFVGDNNEIKYLVEDTGINFIYRIRPKNNVINDFFNNLDSFEKVLLNRQSSPLYTATFEIIDENLRGYNQHTTSFTFPTTFGGYNLGTVGLSFDNYVSRLSKVAEFYDERFTDNLWRSMTHESIKNFDWTFTRKFAEGEDEPYVEGGQKIQKIIRLYGRQFDEVKMYIDGISNSNNLSYDDVDNLPDYFMTDKVEEYGWDLKLIYPLSLKEYIKGSENMPYDFHKDLYDDDGKLKDGVTEISFEPKNEKELENGTIVGIKRIFTQDYDSMFCYPYHVKNETKKEDDFKFDKSVLHLDINCENSNNIQFETISLKALYDDCENSNSIKYYTNNTKYSYVDINTEFMRRLALNSKHIMRKKGTMDGLEMVFAMFNMKRGKNYDIKEYTMFAPFKDDNYNESLNDYEVSWVNSTKLTTYNTESFRNGVYVPYQGIPVTYREISAKTGDDTIVYRRLYPFFDKNAEYDGGMYYQMNGGWLRKRPFMFDGDNNIIPEGYDKNNDRTTRLFTETNKNIKCVQTLQELLETPSLATDNGNIVQVLDLSGRYAVIDGILYNLFTEENGVTIEEDEANGKVTTTEILYFSVNIDNGSLFVGTAAFFDYVVITNPYYPNGRQRVDLTDNYYDGRELKIYVIKETEEITDTDGTHKKTVRYNLNISANETSISTFTVFEDGKYMDGDNFTNYFRINNKEYYNEISVFGWQQLRDNEYDYFIMNAMSDYREGNNPHDGHMNYDNGHEYLYRFKHIFKYAYDNDLIEYRDYEGREDKLLDYFKTFGFENLVKNNDCDKNYDEYIIEDTKCHYFGDILKKESDGKSVVLEYDENGTIERDSINDNKYNLRTYSKDGDVFNFIIKPTQNSMGYGGYLTTSTERDDIDGCTHQIVNTKRMDIVIYIDSEVEYDKTYLEQVKYYDSVVMSYIQQMIPSTMICTVTYKLGK